MINFVIDFFIRFKCYIFMSMKNNFQHYFNL
jgi:hypothetical protein